MKIYKTQAEEDCIQTLQLLHKERNLWVALRINLSKLTHFDRDTQDIVFYVLKDNFQDCRGKLFCLDNKDFLFLFPRSDVDTLRLLEGKIRHLFIYDPLVCSPPLGTTFSNFSPLEECYDGLMMECHRMLLHIAENDPNAPKAKREVTIDRMSFETAAETRKIRSRLQVLIVEDHPFIRKMIARTLGTEVEIIQVSNGYDAVEAYCRTAPDIVFLDIEMPELDGHDVLKSLNQLDPDAFIVMLTAHKGCEHILKAKENNAQGYVMKPITSVKLQQCIQQYKTKLEKEPYAKVR
jgi:two-component system, chemotaxis family, chemotaxis protein CheY